MLQGPTVPHFETTQITVRFLFLSLVSLPFPHRGKHGCRLNKQLRNKLIVCFRVSATWKSVFGFYKDTQGNRGNELKVLKIYSIPCNHLISRPKLSRSAWVGRGAGGKKTVVGGREISNV